MGCLNSGCGSNPLEAGIELLPAAASDVQVVGNRVYFREGEQIKAVDLACVSAGNCLGSAFVIGTNAAPRTLFHAANNTLVYTAYASDANNPNDREIRVVELNCLPNCQPVTLMTNAVAGLASPNGAYVVADIGGVGLNIVRIADLNRVFLSDSMGVLGSGLLTARWE